MSTTDVPKPESILAFDAFTGGFGSGPDTPALLKEVTFTVRRAAVTALVGETGSGKTLTSLAVLGLTPAGFRRTKGRILFDGAEVTAYDDAGHRRNRGSRIAMVFQDSRNALNPVFTIGTQLVDVCRLHSQLNRREARQKAEQLLQQVRVPEPRRRLGQYPHELSGGTVQRIQLAMALACRPELLILDEPTTGLDVTIQADILELIIDLTRSQGLSTLIITHDLGVVAQTCTEVVVMRDGEVRETGTCEQIMTAPTDQYTRELLAASRVETSAA